MTSGSLARFLALTFAATWACFIAAAVIMSRRPPGATVGLELQALLLLGTVAPSLVALALTRRDEGEAGVGALLGRVGRWQVPARYYLFAVGYMAVARLMAAVVYRVVTGAWPHFWGEPWYVMLAALAVSTWVQAGEEIGWRGYVLPRLAARIGLGPAGIVLGLIWATWHLPLFYLRGADTYHQSFTAYALQVTALSVAMAWLYWRTQGSLLLVMLMHAAVNNTKNIVPTVPRPPADPFVPSASLLSWLGVAVLWALALFFLIRMRKADLASALDPPRAAG